MSTEDMENEQNLKLCTFDFSVSSVLSVDL